MARNLVRFDPFAELSALQKRFFEDGVFGPAQGTHRPTTDIYTEDDNTLTVEAHLPQFEEKDITVDVDRGALVMTRGLGIFEWAGTEVAGEEPDVVLSCAGDVPTLEVLAAASLLRQAIPDLKVRVVNVVDLMRLVNEGEHPHGMSDREYDAVFTKDRPVIFAYHGYPWLIHRLTYRRNGHANLHVRGYNEEGTTTTPFDMVMLNDIDRYHLVVDVLDRVPGLGERYAGLRQRMLDARVRARAYTREHGEDIPEVADWTWTAGPEQQAREVNTEVGQVTATGGDNEA